MKNKTQTPSLASDLGAIAGLYRTVFWMFGQRLSHGPEWQERLGDDALRVQAMERREETRVPVHHN